LLNKEEFQEPGTAGAELPERMIFEKLLGLLEQDIRLLDGLIQSFGMLQDMENGEVPPYLTITKELVQDTTGYRYKYTVTNAAEGVALKDVEVTDSSLGLIKTQTGEEKFSLDVGTSVELFSDYQQFDCITCQGCVCRWCNFAIAMGCQVTDDKIVYNLSNYVCHSSSGGETGEALHGELTQALPCCDYVLLTDTGQECWLIVEESNAEVKAKLEQILSYCQEAGITPLVEASGIYYENYQSDCWTGPALIVKDVHYAVEVVKSAEPITAKVGEEVKYKAAVHNYWNKRFISGEVDDFNCGETSALHHFPIEEIAPESDLSAPVTWSETYASEGDHCDFTNVKGEVEVSGGTKAILWDSNMVTVTVTGGLGLVKSVDAPTAYPGQVLVYTYELTNNFGSVETSVSIVDDLLGPVTSDQTLQPGEAKVFKKGYQVPTKGEIPDILTNKATATVTIQTSSAPVEEQITGESNTVTVNIIKDCKETDYVPTTAWGMILKDGACYYLDVAHDTDEIIHYKLIGDAAELAKYLTEDINYPIWVAVSGCLNTAFSPEICDGVAFTGQMNVGYIRKALQVEKVGDRTEGRTGDSVAYTFFVTNRWHLPIKFTLYDDPDTGVPQSIKEDQLDPGVVYTYYYSSTVGDMGDGNFCDKPSVAGVEIGSAMNRNFNDVGPLWCIEAAPPKEIV
jgi:uncharacterized repeat protein (TIGR01451 family)